MDTQFTCEATGVTAFGQKQACGKNASHIYGPECEAQTGQLMYLCDSHTSQVAFWMVGHPNDPVECPDHGNIGKVKDYLILKRMT